MATVSLTSACSAPYGEELLAGIEFDLQRGQVLGILGPNGAGKTTLLNLLCGSAPLDRGRYLLAGRPFSDWPVAERARGQAVLPQHSTLAFPYTVEEVILLGRTPHASGARADAQILEETLAATDTARLRNRLYTQLSGGEKQRVQLARVFAQIWREQDSEHRLLLLDEPTSALDLAHQRLIMQGIRFLAEQGCSVVMVLHDFNLASRHADQCLVLDQGRQWFHGITSEALTTAMFGEVFGVDALITRHPVDDIPVIVY